MPIDLLHWLGWSSLGQLNFIGFILTLLSVVGILALLAVLPRQLPLPLRDDGATRVFACGTVIVATLTFYPLIKAFTLGQIQVWINFLFIVGCIAWLVDRKALAGAVIGFICLLKPQFLLFVLWGLLRRQGPFLYGWAIIAVPLGTLSVARYGIENHIDFFSVLSFVSQHGESYFPNNCFNGLANRALFNGDNLIWRTEGLPSQFPPYDVRVHVITFVTSALIIGAALFTRVRDSEKGGIIDFMIAALSFTIASPVAWEHHYGITLPIYLIAFFIVLNHNYYDQGRYGSMSLYLLALSYFLSSNLFSILNWTSGTVFNFVQSYLLFGGLLLLILLYRLRSCSRTKHLVR